jgi:glycosyltransferase involved in cell wall biosynthesis
MTIRYLHVIHSLNPTTGGPPEGVKHLANAAMQMDHHVEIVTFEPVREPERCAYHCPIHVLSPSYMKYGVCLDFPSWLRTHADRFDAIVINGIWQYHGLAVWRAARRLGVPYYVFLHGMLDPWFRRRYPLKHFKKSLYWACIERRILRDAHGVLFTCDEERRLAQRTFYGYRANEIVTGYGISQPTGDPAVQSESFLKAFPALRGRRILLFMGRIHEKKGCDLLIQAFAHFACVDPDLRLVIAGPDDSGQRATLESLCRGLGVAERVLWTGTLSGDQKYGALRCAEVFVLPSHQENFGIAVVEAMACGVPVLISDKVNIWREITEDHAGLVADDTLAGTTRLLQDWLEMTPAGRNRLATNAAGCFQRRFHNEAAARALVSVIERGGKERRRVA